MTLGITSKAVEVLPNTACTLPCRIVGRPLNLVRMGIGAKSGNLAGNASMAEAIAVLPSYRESPTASSPVPTPIPMPTHAFTLSHTWSLLNFSLTLEVVQSIHLLALDSASRPR